MSAAEEPKGLILTVGMQPEPLLFSLRQLTPHSVAFICTPGSKLTLDEVLKDYPLEYSHTRCFDVEDEPSQIGRLVHEFNSAFLWLQHDQNIPPSQIYADPTAGRKWMSAGATMIASFLGLSMFYTDAKYIKGVPDSATMRFVPLGNAYDQTGFLQAEGARDLFNRFEFAAAAKLFSELKPTISRLSDLFTGLASLAKTLHRWELFDHYSNSLKADFDLALTELRRADYSSSSSLAFGQFLDKVDHLAHAVQAVTDATKPALEAVVDLVQNGLRRIEQGRYDDAVARFYRALEATSQFYLMRRGIDSTKPDYGKITPSQRDDATQALGKCLPQYIGLNDGWRMLHSWNEPAAASIFKTSKGKSHKSHNIFQGLLEKRNGSIMAHGWNPVGKEEAQKMAQQMENLVNGLEEGGFKELFSRLKVPRLPSLWKIEDQ